MGKVASLVKYSKGITDFICEKIEDGVCLAEICRTYPDVVPIEKTCYRWKRQYPEFKERINEAYETFFYKKIDEVEEISKSPVPIYRTDADGTFVHDDEGEKIKLDKSEISAMLNARRIRLDTLKFVLAKLAPKLVKDLKEKDDNRIGVMPSITIVNYKPE